MERYDLTVSMHPQASRETVRAKLSLWFTPTEEGSGIQMPPIDAG
jgi:hypothetical protein